MKIKITSLILAISILLSMLTVFAFASEATTKSSYTSTYLHYKNSYGDDIDDKGSHPNLLNKVNSTYEIKSETNGNKYGYYNFNDGNKNVYMSFDVKTSNSVGPEQLGYLIFEFDFNDLGNALQTNKLLDIISGTGDWGNNGRLSASDAINIANDTNGNYFYLNNDKNNKIYIKSNEWVHIRCEMSVLSTDATKYTFKCCVGDKSFSTEFKLGTPNLVSQLRFGSTNTLNQKFALDNMLLYSAPENIKYSDVGIVKGTISMKIGAENASVDGVQVELKSVPLLINGNIYCPVDVIEKYVDKACPDAYKVFIENAEYILIDDISTAFGVAAKSYDMGLILIGNEWNIFGDDVSYNEIAEVMKNFVFNIPSASKIKTDVATHTNGYDHPYLLADADKFAELRSIYKQSSGLDNETLVLKNYITQYVSKAETQFKNYCGTTPSSYSGILDAKIPVNKNYSDYSNNGYDNGGRLSVDTAPLLYFAFAYQMTGNLNYARAAYDFMIALGEWNHWGPDHFLNCADTAAPFSIAYDWLYDAFTELNSKGEISKRDKEVYDKSKLATILFTHVIIPGYVQSNNLTCPWPGSANSRYATKTSNWNAVCVSGVVMAAMMLLNEDVSTAGMTFKTQKKNSSTSFTQTVTKIEDIGNSSIHAGLTTYADYAAKLTSMNLGTLAKYGLDQYMPDGSYIESPGYWSYGTNSFFRLVASLLSATGDDYGFMDAWGIDTTCYFAIHSESSDYKTWNFNDGSVGAQDSSFFFFVGNYYGDNNLIKVRKKHLNTGKGYSLYDILYYDVAVTGEPELATEYEMVGIDAFSVRSSWDKGAIYAGLIGGANNCSHGQMDAGSFIYHNKGKIWFHDLGADNYNIRYVNKNGVSKGYFSNFELYRIGAEGHNIITLTSQQSSLPYGQTTNANPKIIGTNYSEHGGYAVLDMSRAYGSHVTSAKRGMLFTNSRNTVVIQDEYVFNGVQTAYWFGHYQLATGYVDEVVISADGRTAFMKSGNDTLRVSILSDNSNLKFEIMDCYTYTLDVTKRTDRDNMGKSETENNRDSLRKLAIKCENVTTLNLAVVIEEVSDFEIGSSYTYVPIADWESQRGEKEIIENNFKAEFDRDKYTIGSYELETKDNGYSLEILENGKNSYMGIIANTAFDASSTASLMLYNRKNSSINFAQNKYVAIDFDVFTESIFINGAQLGFNVKDLNGSSAFVPLLKFYDGYITVGDKNIYVINNFKHVTILINTVNFTVSVYADDLFTANISGFSYKSIDTMELLLPDSVRCSSMILLDNVNVRSFSGEYDSSALDNILASKDSLSSWEDRIAYRSITTPIATQNGKNLYTNTDIEKEIKNGNTVTLLRDTAGIINISGAGAVKTNGYRFKYVSDSYFPILENDQISFSSGSLTVTWHIGNSTETEIYNGSSIAEYKGSSSLIGRITCERIEYADGGIGYKFYTTGWSNVMGGKALNEEEMIVSNGNNEFWLVNNVPFNCLFVTIDASNNVIPYNTESSLQTQIKSSNNLSIVLCDDVELTNTSAIVLAKSGKNLYLNGRTLSHKQYDAHLFNYSKSTSDNFKFIGPGTIESVGSRTIFTSDSSKNDTTSKYGVVVEYVNIVTNGQLADLRIGQHKFIGCNIRHTDTSKSLFALWNKNGNMISAGVPENLLSISFDNCTIISNLTSTASLFSYSASSYSEIYVNNTAIYTKGLLIDSDSTISKLAVSGNSKLVFGKISRYDIKYSKISFGNGVTTNYEIPYIYLPSGAVLTNNYDDTLSYRVSDNYAVVTWKTADGADIHTDYVAVGVTPRITSDEVKAYLNGAGKGYTYTLSAITGPGAVDFIPVRTEAVTVFQSMTLGEDITINVYFNKSQFDSSIAFVTVNSVKLMCNAYTLVNIGGVEYYTYKITSITPANACDEIMIKISYLGGDTTSFAASPVNYLENLLAISENDDEKILAVKTLKYIADAHSYFAPANLTDRARIDDIISTYKTYDRIYASLKEEYVATGILKDSIKSVCYNLSASVRIRFYLNPEFSGRINVQLAEETVYYDVINGKVHGRNYFEVFMSADAINEKLVITIGDNSIEYGLNAYATSFNNADQRLKQLLVSLANYSAAAKSYTSK